MIQFDQTPAIFPPQPYTGITGPQPKIGLFVMDDWHYERLVPTLEMRELTNVHGLTLDSPKLATIDGQALFLPDGGNGGAAAVVMEMERMIASGVKAIVAFGTAGALHKTTETGTIVVPSAAIRDEGTSYHYSPGNRPRRCLACYNPA